MRKAVLASVFAFAIMGFSFISERGIGVASAQAQEVVVTEGHIARLRSALRLNATQEPHWRAVESTLRSIIRGQRREGAGEGLVQRVRARASGYVVQVAALQQLASVAQPLIASLDEGQRRSGMAAMRAMGVSALF
jgi:hypothetical protein